MSFGGLGGPGAVGASRLLAEIEEPPRGTGRRRDVATARACGAW